MDEWERWGDVGEADWKRQVVVRDLKRGVEDDAIAYTYTIAPHSVIHTHMEHDRKSRRNAP